MPLGKVTWTLERLSVVVSPRLILDFGISQRPLFCDLDTSFQMSYFTTSKKKERFILWSWKIHVKQMWQGPAIFQLVNNSPFERVLLENRELFIILGRSPGERNGSPLQYSCLENPMDRGARWATVHGITKESDMTQELDNYTTTTQVCTRASRHGPGVGDDVSRKIFASLVEQIRPKMTISSVKK